MRYIPVCTKDLFNDQSLMMRVNAGKLCIVYKKQKTPRGIAWKMTSS